MPNAPLQIVNIEMYSVYTGALVADERFVPASICAVEEREDKIQTSSTAFWG
jgi:hypothetical protein